MMSDNSSGTPSITPEIRARIEENRKKALERLQLTRLKTAKDPARQNVETKNLPVKEVASNPSRIEPCMIAQIEENRKKALERLQLTRLRTAKDPARQNVETKNLPVKEVASNPSRIEPSMSAQIEENRKKALERLQLTRSNKNENSAPNVMKTKILPTKEIASNRVAPYQKPPPVVQRHLPAAPASSSKEAVPAPATVKKPKLKTYCEFVLQSENRFIIKCQYDDEVIATFKTIQTGTYLPETKTWSFSIHEYNDVVKALQSLKHVQLNLLKDFTVKLLTEKRAEPNEECLEHIEPELVNTLLDFQREGVAFGVSRGGRCLIADDMGLGKSRQALAIADYYRDDWPLLIVTNASTRGFWAKEIDELLPKVPSHDVRLMQYQNETLAGENIVICSYSTLQQDHSNLMRKHFGVIIFDESHNLKNAKAKQTENSKKLASYATRVIMLTGTPALSRPVELYPQLEILDSNFVNYYEFTKRYCNASKTKFGWDASGASNLEELGFLLKKTLMIRRIKNEVYAELGNKKRTLVILEDYELNLGNQGNSNAEMEEYASQFQNTNYITKDTEMALLRWYQKTAEVKAFGAFQFIKDYLSKNDSKILVFAHHHFMMDVLCAELEKIDVQFIRIDGAVRGETRSQRVAAFQNDSNIRVAVLSIRACNAGITLTRASAVIFCELDWNPSTIIQAEARAHRIGQENQVNVYYLIASQTADEFIWKILSGKQKRLGQAGLVANVENLVTNVETVTFNVKKQTISNNNNNDNNERDKQIPVLSSSQFDDDDIIFANQVDQILKDMPFEC